MTELITGSQMASIDRRAIDSGVPGIELMEAAGQGITRVVENLLGELQNRHIVILCGKGNNGGDGFVVARQAIQRGAKVQVFTATSANEITGDAKTNFNRLPSDSVQSVDRIATVQNALTNADIAIDALLGTGIRGPARGIYADLINALSRAKCPIVAVDIPSGLNADTGKIEGPCATATCTVTFALPRIGHFFYPGRAQCGKLHLIDIGIPTAAIENERISTYLIDNRRCARLLPRRAPDAHKGDCGKVYILAGSVGLTGAAALSANAALRGGAGLVTLGVPKSLNDILEIKVTEAMTHPLPEVKKVRCLSLRARGDIQRAYRTADSIAIGPGLGTHRETVALIRRLVRDLNCPAVIDADALNALAGDLDAIRACETPPGTHPTYRGICAPDPVQHRRNTARPYCTGSGICLRCRCHHTPERRTEHSRNARRPGAHQPNRQSGNGHRRHRRRTHRPIGRTHRSWTQHLRRCMHSRLSSRPRRRYRSKKNGTHKPDCQRHHRKLCRCHSPNTQRRQ